MALHFKYVFPKTEVYNDAVQHTYKSIVSRLGEKEFVWDVVPDSIVEKFRNSRSQRMKNLYFLRRTAAKLIKKHNGRFITIVFIKRTDGKIRIMNCKFNEEQDKKKLFLVSELKQLNNNTNALRAIPQDLILEIRINGRIYRPKGESYQSMAAN